MKKIVLITLLFVFCFNKLFAQHPKNHEKFKAHKIAFITQKLDLTSKEAEKFWPIYNSYEKKAFEIKVTRNRAIQKQIRENGGFGTLNKNESNHYISNLLQNEEEFVILKKKFYADLKNILSSKKMLKLYHAENGFNRKLLSELRKKTP